MSIFSCYHEFTMSYLLTYVLIYKHHVWLCPQREWFCKSKQNSLNLSTKKFKTNIIFWIKCNNNLFFAYQFSCVHRVASTLHFIPHSYSLHILYSIDFALFPFVKFLHFVTFICKSSCIDKLILNLLLRLATLIVDGIQLLLYWIYVNSITFKFTLQIVRLDWKIDDTFQ